jgi:predicted transcriptional regulator
MKSKGLLSLLTFSEKRRDLLLFLLEQPSTLTNIRKKFNVSSPEIAPRIREMESANLMYKDPSTKMYTLTTTGKIIAKSFKPFVDMVGLLEKNEDFWNDHDLSGIPDHLLGRLVDLKDCDFYVDRLENIYDSHKTFTENIERSSVIKGVSPIFFPSYPDFFMQLAEKDVPTSLILTKDVYDKVEREHAEKMRAYYDGKYTELSLLDSAKVAFVVTDVFFSMSLFFKSGNYDPRTDLICFDKMGIQWGNDLFDHYLSQAKKI